MDIPPTKPSDTEDVAWGLQTASSLWKRGERGDAVAWLRRAAQAASDATDDDRALELARAAAELADIVGAEGMMMPGASAAPAAPESIPVATDSEESTALDALPKAAAAADELPISDHTPSVLPAEKVHAGMFDPWSEPPAGTPAANAPVLVPPIINVDIPVPVAPITQPMFGGEEVVTSAKGDVADAGSTPSKPAPPKPPPLPPGASRKPPPLPARALKKPPVPPSASKHPVAPSAPAPATAFVHEAPTAQVSMPAELAQSVAASQPPSQAQTAPPPIPPPPELFVPPPVPAELFAAVPPPGPLLPAPEPEQPRFPTPPMASRPIPPVGAAAPMRTPPPPAPFAPPLVDGDDRSEDEESAAETTPPPPVEVTAAKVNELDEPDDDAPTPFAPAVAAREASTENTADLASALSAEFGGPSDVEPTPALPPAPPSAEGASTGATVETPKLDLENVDAFSDLPDDARAEFAAAGEVHVLSEGEEVAGFALAYVVEGWFDVAATMVDAAAVRLAEGAVLRSRGTTNEGVPMRIIAGEPRGVVATWSGDAVETAFSNCPWVEEDLRAASDRVMMLVGITIGPLGERLDQSIREEIVGRLTVKPLVPGEIIVNKGEPVPGLLLVGVGEIELVDGDDVKGIVGSGDFLFATEVLSQGAAPYTARAGAGGALAMFGNRAIAQELMVTCPPLLEVFAGM